MDPRHQPNDWSLAEGTHVRVEDWTVADLIDFEFYLDADERELREKPSSRKALADRDRAIYLERIEGQVAGEAPHTPAHRRGSLRRWLMARRESEEPSLRELLPGRAFASAQRLGTLALAGAGLFCGVAVTSALLSYDGHLPVSVPWFVFLLVVMQFVLIVVAGWTWALRGIRRDRTAAEDSWLLNHAIRPLFARAAHWFQEQRLAHATAEMHERALATQGLVRSQFVVYGPVSVLALLIPAQVFGVAFNVGVIATTIMLEWFTDIAFGWGTSLAAHPQTMFDLVRVIASPWSWLFGEGVGYPTLEQIEGSRIYLEQWASAAASFKPDPEHLRSWRWFLVLAVFTYGLLPRLILLAVSLVARHFALLRLSFTHGRIQALYARLLTPRLDTAGAESGQGPEMHIPGELAARPPRSVPVAALHEGKPAIDKRPWRETASGARQVPIATPSETEPTPLPVDAPKPAAAPEVVESPQWEPARVAEPPTVEIVPEPAVGRVVETITEVEQAPAEVTPSPEVETLHTKEVEPEPELEIAWDWAELPPREALDEAREPEPISESEPIPEPQPEREEPPKLAETLEPVEPTPEAPALAEPAVPGIVGELSSARAAEPRPEVGEVAAAEPPAREETAAAPVPVVVGESFESEGSRAQAQETAPGDAVPEAVGEPEHRETPILSVTAKPVAWAEAIADLEPPEEPIESQPESEPSEPPQDFASVELDLTVAAHEPEPEPEPERLATASEAEAEPTEPLDQAPVIAFEAQAPISAGEGRVRFAPDACLMLVHVDIDDVLEAEDRPRLEQLLRDLSGWRVAAHATFGAGSAMTAQALSLLDAGDWQAPPARIAVVQDGSQPPITENLVFLRELRAAAGAQAQMLLALVGDPEDDDRLPPLPAFEYTDWQRKIDQMADPYLRLEMLAPASEDGEV